MKISLVFMSALCMQVAMVHAMDTADSELSLNQLGKAEISRISLTNPLPGDHNIQRLTVQDLAKKLPEVIVSDTDGNFEVHVTELRTLLINTAQALPNPNESLEAVKLNAASAGTEGIRLLNMLSGKKKAGAVFTAVGSIFILGMIAGWFYTTKAHAAAGHNVGH